MSSKYVYKTYYIKGTADAIRKGLTGSLLSNGYKQAGKENNVFYFRYPSITFSSRRPLTCISRLSMEITGQSEKNQVKIGVNFAKIRYFTTIMMFSICVLLPALLGYIKNGMPDFPPMAFLGIPLGFMLHYHVRWRVFRALNRLISQAGEI